jgi:hypothetical protein
VRTEKKKTAGASFLFLIFLLKESYFAGGQTFFTAVYMVIYACFRTKTTEKCENFALSYFKKEKKYTRADLTLFFSRKA